MALAGLAVLLKLGFWQISRIPQKADEIAKIDHFIGEAPQPLPEQVSVAQNEYQPVLLEGTFAEGELHVLVSTRDYGAGFRIIAPFVTQTGRRVMIDRGYVRSEFKEAERPLGHAEIIGNLHWPDETGYWIPEDDLDANYWYARTVEKMAQALDTEPVLIVARNRTDEAIQPLPVSTQHIPNNHLSYAIQWFLFAIIWIGMTTALLWRIRSGRSPKSDGQ